jgi:hypothetical protein
MTQVAPYSYATFVQVRQSLADRLFDSNQVFWSSAELNAYLVEALQTWNALTNYWRGDFEFPAQQGVTWYDITLAPNTLRPLTVTDATLYSLIQYHLLEPQGMNPWAGSTQFSANDVVNAVQRRRDEVLSTASCTQTRRLVGAVAGRITLPDTVIDVRRIAYLPTQAFSPALGYGSGRYGFGLYGVTDVPYVNLPQPIALFPADAWDEQSFNQNYIQTPAGTPFTPTAYLLSTQPPISFDTDAPPAFGGSYELLTVEAGGALNVAAPATLNVPDDWTHVIKWGALADLFGRDSNARDPLRAQYCEQRYRMGLALLTSAAALLQFRINNVPVQLDSVRGADLFNSTWQGTTQGAPKSAYHSGLNLVAVSPLPDSGLYTFTATVVENAPVPVLDTDFVQVGRDVLDALLDYSQHLATLKSGGAEFMATQQHLQRFLLLAATYNRKLMELGEFASYLLGLSQLEKNLAPVETPEVPQ